MMKLDTAEIRRPVNKAVGVSPCGDATLVFENDSYLLFAIVDGAGHGKEAAKVADSAIHFIEKHREENLSHILLSIHRNMMNTCGGVASICRINKKTGGMSYCGVGNITTRLFKPESVRLVSRDGVLGHEICRPLIKEIQLKRGDIVMMYSDGVVDHFEVGEVPHFYGLASIDIAKISVERFRKSHDDASCVVAKVIYD